MVGAGVRLLELNATRAAVGNCKPLCMFISLSQTPSYQRMSSSDLESIWKDFSFFFFLYFERSAGLSHNSNKLLSDRGQLSGEQNEEEL